MDPSSLSSLSTSQIAGIGESATGAGAGLGAIGSLLGGQAQQSMYNYQAGVALLNAQIAKQNETYAFNQGEAEAQKYGIGAAQRMGAIKTAQGASGLDVNSGSAVGVRASQQFTTTMDLEQIRSNAAKTAYNFSVQAVQDQAQANIYKMAGANAAAAGAVGAATSILGGVKSVSSEWLQASQVGLGGSGNQAFGFGTGIGMA